MSKLIKNELIKIFKKKTIYIALIAVLLLLIFMNCILKFSGSSSNETLSYTHLDVYKRQVRIHAIESLRFPGEGSSAQGKSGPKELSLIHI